MMTFARRFDRGDSLIEVLIALSLSAVTALGIIGAQMWLARNERSVMMRETAVSIADSVAEGICRDADRDPIVAQWRARAAAALPDGGVDVLDRGNGVHVAVVKWRPPASGNGDEPLCAERGVRRAVIESWLHRQIEITESGAVAHWRRVVAKPFQTSSP